MKRKRVVLGLLGPTLDNGTGPGRWEKWRPTVALCSQEDFLVQRFELLHQAQYTRLAQVVAGDIASVSPETTVQSHLVEWVDPWDFEEVYGALLDFARAYPFDPEGEEYFIHITTGTHVAQICLFLLTETRYFPATLVQCSPPPRQRAGQAGEYRVIDLDLSRYDRLASRYRQAIRDAEEYLKSGIPTRNPAFNALISQIERVAIQSRAPLLLTGPTGAGKSQLARKIYELKKQRNQLSGALVEVNCATLRGDGAMSALFGHARGAYTGAAQARAGLLRAADRGVLFLDEIGELGLDEQAMLLRAIEEKRFAPLGSDVETTSDFQLIAGTNRLLRTEVRAGRFREDLLARINLWPFRLPGLAERPEDIEPNLDYELARFAERSGQFVRMSSEARQEFLAFAEGGIWSGNFRDLNAAVTRMATLAEGGRISVHDVRDEIARLGQIWAGETRTGAPTELSFATRTGLASGVAPLGDSSGSVLEQGDREVLRQVLSARAVAALDLFESAQLAAVLRVCRECATLAEAGRRLFAVSRQATRHRNDSDRLRKYLAKFDLDWERSRRWRDDDG